MIYSILFVILAALAYWYWSAIFIPKEVRENAADFIANGSADDLQAGYHGRETWSRIWPALACCLVPAIPLTLGGGVGGGVLGFLSMVALIGGYFARWFSPLLNEARTATRPDITTWYASPASKSWWPKPRIHKASAVQRIGGLALKSLASQI